MNTRANFHLVNAISNRKELNFLKENKNIEQIQ